MLLIRAQYLKNKEASLGHLHILGVTQPQCWHKFCYMRLKAAVPASLAQVCQLL